GEPHVSENDGAASTGSDEVGTGEAAAALEAPGEAGDLQGDTDRAEPRDRGPARRPGGRRYSPVVMRIAAEHDVDLEQVKGTRRGGRVPKQDVLAFIDGGKQPAEEPPMHIESPYRPDAPAPPKKREPRFGAAQEPEAAPAPVEVGDLGPVRSGPLS